MTKTEKIKKIILISIGFALATYLMMSGYAILNKDTDTTASNSEQVSKK